MDRGEEPSGDACHTSVYGRDQVWARGLAGGCDSEKEEHDHHVIWRDLGLGAIADSRVVDEYGGEMVEKYDWDE